VADEIQYASSGLAGPWYAIIRDDVGLVWDGAAFVAYASANYASYVVAMGEQGAASRYFVGDFPVAIPAGLYRTTVYRDSGTGPAEGDTVGARLEHHWDGKVMVPTWLAFHAAHLIAGPKHEVARGGATPSRITVYELDGETVLFTLTPAAAAADKTTYTKA